MTILRIAARLLLLFAAVLSAAPVAADNFLWEVVSVTNRVYLFGTVHAGKAEWYPLPTAVENAYADCAVLAVEADISDTTAMSKSAAAMTYAPPDSLANHVPADDYLRFRRLTARYTIPEAQAAQLKPFMAVSLLVFGEWARAGFLPQFGVDSYFIRKAKAELKPIVEIEGVETQIRLLQSLTEKENLTIFAGTLTALDSGLTTEQIVGMVDAWKAGDPKGMLQVARHYDDLVPGALDFEEKFVWSRHDDMVKKIEGFLNNSKERHFIAVGALHLAGPRGLVEMLRSRGYIVKQR
jgi:uncharacterized protein YbaP (TraB family)